MRIRVMAMIDEVIDVNKDEYEEALAKGELAKWMHPHLCKIDIELTYGPEDEFDGSSV